jgi:hypothetical protein
MKVRLRALSLSLFAASLVIASSAQAFCGFYVGKADASLFNEASQVIMARDGNRTVISMLNDYKGALTEFALVVPVPTVLQREQVNVGERAMFDRLDAYSAPRLAEYHDEDPCAPRRYEMLERAKGALSVAAPAAAPAMAKRDLGVSVEASYTVGEYDIVMLSAKQSDGLETWLTSNGYRIPAGASKALGPYIKQGMKFFVAKVNLKEQAKTGTQTLRPIQFAFDSEKFMLPLRLGMINANGPQDLIVYMLTRNGRVESSNYRTVPLPANMDLPVFVRSDFKSFYKAMFDRQAAKEDFKVVFTEYFWDMAWCDPCAADPLSSTELRKAGAFWVNSNEPSRRFNQGAQPALLTRLHVRYTKETFPEDLMFQQTGDKQNFQTRYVLRHAFAGSPTACDVAKQYYDGVAKRQEKEAQQLASLTGWTMSSVREKMPYMQTSSSPSQGWWKDLWVQ